MYSLHSRERKKKKPLQSCRYHCNTTNFGGGGKGESPKRKGEQEQKLNQLEKSKSSQKWDETPNQPLKHPHLPQSQDVTAPCWTCLEQHAPRQHSRLLQSAQPQVGPRRWRKIRSCGKGCRSGMKSAMYKTYLELASKWEGQRAWQRKRRSPHQSQSKDRVENQIEDKTRNKQAKW